MFGKIEGKHAVPGVLVNAVVLVLGLPGTVIGGVVVSIRIEVLVFGWISAFFA